MLGPDDNDDLLLVKSSVVTLWLAFKVSVVPLVLPFVVALGGSRVTLLVEWM